MKPERLLAGARTVAVTDAQFGDNGKGKLVDCLAEWADVIARGTGGANAGHTIQAGNTKIVVHLVPSGIMHPGKINVIGNGVVLDPRQLVREINELSQAGIDCKDRLLIAQNAKLVLPQHIVLDRIHEACAGKGKLGTTGRGIGPAYADHYNRTGLIVNDLHNMNVFKEKLKRNLENAERIARGYGRPEALHQILHQADFENGRFYSEETVFDADEIADAYFEAVKRIYPMIDDTDAYIRSILGEKNILAEGAQGLLLSIDYGTYPFVTSSDCSDQGLARGIGLLHRDIELTLAIAKGFYMTRVGEGPFPTEMGGKESDLWCGSIASEEAKAAGLASARELEAKRYGDLTLDEKDEFKFGIAVRRAGDEYGATTGRPRRTGWLDLPLLRHSVASTGNRDLVFTKLDVLDKCPVIKICTGYEYVGPDYRIGRKTLSEGTILDTAVMDPFILRHCYPIYTQFAGWLQSTRGATSEGELPERLMDIVHYVEQETGTHVRILSVGPDRDQTILLQ